MSSLKSIFKKFSLNFSQRLEVPDADTEKEFRLNAQRVWRARHSEKSYQRGRESCVGLVIEEIFLIWRELKEKAEKELAESHEGHAQVTAVPGDPNATYIPAVFLCEVCKEKEPLKSSAYKLCSAIMKKLEAKKVQSQSNLPVPSRKTVEEHIRGWLYMLGQNAWFETGIPEEERDRFPLDMLKAFEDRRKACMGNLDDYISTSYEGHVIATFFKELTKPRKKSRSSSR